MISIGGFIYFIEPIFQSFIDGMQSNAWDYIGKHGYFGLELLLWL